MKLLLVHGVGNAERDPDWDRPWREIITRGLQEHKPGMEPTYARFDYDDLFDRWPDPITYMWAVARLLSAPVADWIFGRRGFFDKIGAAIDVTDRWHAGMVARWVVEEHTRNELEKRFSAVLERERPDVIFAHSLGSLIAYDYFDSRADIADPPARGRILVTFGSQIGNIFVRSERFGGRIRGIGAKYWFHLFNPQDKVFTAQIKEPIVNFEQLMAESPAGHDALTDNVAKPGYLQHPVMRDHIYSVLATTPGVRALENRQRAMAKIRKRPERRALLVGINQYPNPANNLEGCVNDIYKISALLQDAGVAAENIRVLFDERATRQAIIDRLEWLLDGSGDGQERIFYYSGHGAQLPAYNSEEIVDHVDECLVCHDFDWVKESAVTDDDFCQFYSALSYETRFYAFFDCCHSGGMARDGGRRIRAINPPDDVRHRLLEWNREEHAWQERKLPSLNPDFGPVEAQKRFMGSNKATVKLGRNMPLLRDQTEKCYDKRKRSPRVTGPYMPVIFEACSENNFAYEYRDGATSYGAFTFLLERTLRADLFGKRELTFDGVEKKVRASLVNLGFDQICTVEGPAAARSRKIFVSKPS
jgi:hypothetical protein